MVMNVEIISKEIIKPSSPTPHHLTDLKLSLLDQIAPPIFVPIIFFYHPKWDSSIDHFEKSCLLKKSLSETLTRFYPLAGTLKEDFSVDCNDEGVEYFEACIAGELSEAIKKPDKKILGQFLPFEPYGKGADSGRQLLLAAQFNMFTCGGVAIGVCISHKIADGNSATTFVKAWADTASRGDSSPEAMYPSFDAAFHFPPRDISGIMPTAGITTKDNIVSRSFVFDKSNVTALREKAKAISADGSSQVNQPTRVEAVSAFLWKRFMVMALSKSVKAKAKVFAAVHAVNLRERMVPPLPVHSFGNLTQVAIAPTTVEVEKDYHFLAAQLRNAIRGINGDYVKKLHDGDGYMNTVKEAIEQFSKGEVEFCNFTSWCRFPLYEVDFGWGKPSWVCSPISLYKNTIILMTTRGGDGIEAWVNMLEEDMTLFERDPELTSFVSSTLNGE